MASAVKDFPVDPVKNGDLWCDRAAGSISNSKSLQMDNLIALHNDKGRAGNTQFFHLRADVFINGIKVGRRRLEPKLA